MKRLLSILFLISAFPSWGAIRLVGSSQMPATDDATSSVASATMPLPDGVVGNDVCLEFVNVRSTTVTITNTTAGQATAWTANTAQVGATNTYRSFIVKLPAGGFTASPVFGWTVANSYSAWLLCFRGVDTTTQVDAAEVTAAQAAAATFTNASSFITTSTANAVVIHVFSSVDDNTWGTFTAGPAQPYGLTQWRNASTTGASLTISYLTQAGTGGSAAFSANEATLGNDAGTRAAIALKPASVSAEANFAQAGHFSTGTTTSTVAVTTPVTPKLVIGLQTRIVGDGGGDGLKQGIAIMAEGQQRSVYVGAVDNVGFGNSIISMYKSIWAANWDPNNPDTNAQAKMKATAPYSSTGFTFTPSVAAAENGTISYLALGGDDIQAAAIGEFNLPLGTGSVTYSNIFPFQPDALMFFNSWRSVTAYDELTTVSDTDECVGVQFGFVDASLNQGYTIGGANSQASGATTGSSLSKTGSAYAEYDSTAQFNATHQLRYEGAVTAVSFGGFTMNWTTVDGVTSAADLRMVVAIKLSANGKLRVINANTPTSTGDFDITTDTGGTTLSGTTWAGGFFGSGISGTGGTSRSLDEVMTVGAWDGTNNEAAFWWYQQGGGSSGSVPTDDRSYRNSTLAFAQRSANNASTAVGSATVTNLTNKVRFNFSATDASSHTGVGFVFGPGTAAGVTNPVSRTLLGAGT